jgi:hypothetical protein
MIGSPDNTLECAAAPGGRPAASGVKKDLRRCVEISVSEADSQSRSPHHQF